MNNPDSGSVEASTVEWLLEQIQPHHSPLIDLNKQRLVALIAAQVETATAAAREEERANNSPTRHAHL